MGLQRASPVLERHHTRRFEHTLELEWSGSLMKRDGKAVDSHHAVNGLAEHDKESRASLSEVSSGDMSMIYNLIVRTSTQPIHFSRSHIGSHQRRYTKSNVPSALLPATEIDHWSRSMIDHVCRRHFQSVAMALGLQHCAQGVYCFDAVVKATEKIFRLTTARRVSALPPWSTQLVEKISLRLFSLTVNIHFAHGFSSPLIS